MALNFCPLIRQNLGEESWLKMNPDEQESDPVLTSEELREHIARLLNEMRRLQEESERSRLKSEELRRVVVKRAHQSAEKDVGNIFESQS
jgi:hypothetical protein